MTKHKKITINDVYADFEYIISDTLFMKEYILVNKNTEKHIDSLVNGLTHLRDKIIDAMQNEGYEW